MNGRSWNGWGRGLLIMLSSTRRRSAMKSLIVALSAAALITASPAALAMGTSGKTAHQMHAKSAKKAHTGASTQAKGMGQQGAPQPGQTTGSSTKKGY
ncbi:hypothetical protein [Bradyrhizobium sp. STM 3562]|uniref:hypothetical protein n=1 Tax=Bradyrhizobium sp. STM 3562 TaxID=578924 RepID=UPI003890F7CB